MHAELYYPTRALDTRILTTRLDTVMNSTVFRSIQLQPTRLIECD